MDLLYIGELAAVTTSFLYAMNSALFSAAGRAAGAGVVNRLRLLIGMLFLILGHWIFLGHPWPAEAGFERWFWLGLSGIVGLGLGDAFLFRAFVLIGPRLSMLMISLAPVVAALTAWIFLGEKLNPAQIAGITITLLGTTWVVTGKNGQPSCQAGQFSRGIWFGLAAAVGQGLGVVLAQRGLQGGFSPLSANLIRMFSALILIWIAAGLAGNLKGTFQAAAGSPRSLLLISGGSFAGPFLGVSLSLFALQHSQTGVVSTLISLAPVILLPYERLIEKQPLTPGAVGGTLLALIGVGLLFLA